MDNDLELSIAQIIRKYGLLSNRSRSKRFGQHFLCDQSLLHKIVSCALPFEGHDIIEIGPGPCGLTREIVRHSKDNNIYCIEKDTDLSELHKGFNNSLKRPVNFIYADALNISPRDLTQNKVIIISNLPYNVGTQIFLNILKDLSNVSKMVLMFQKEVAERIYAPVGTKAYGRLSIISQLLCNIERLFDVSNKAFFPEPKVMSTVIKVTPKSNPPIITNLEKLTQLCFQFRRKTIHNILKNSKLGLDADDILSKCNLEKQARPENITPEKFLELSEQIYDA